MDSMEHNNKTSNTEKADTKADMWGISFEEKDNDIAVGNNKHVRSSGDAYSSSLSEENYVCESLSTQTSNIINSSDCKNHGTTATKTQKTPSVIDTTLSPRQQISDSVVVSTRMESTRKLLSVSPVLKLPTSSLLQRRLKRRRSCNKEDGATTSNNLSLPTKPMTSLNDSEIKPLDLSLTVTSPSTLSIGNKSPAQSVWSSQEDLRRESWEEHELNMLFLAGTQMDMDTAAHLYDPFSREATPTSDSEGQAFSRRGSQCSSTAEGDSILQCNGEKGTCDEQIQQPHHFTKTTGTETATRMLNASSFTHSPLASRKRDKKQPIQYFGGDTLKREGEEERIAQARPRYGIPTSATTSSLVKSKAKMKTKSRGRSNTWNSNKGMEDICNSIFQLSPNLVVSHGQCSRQRKEEEVEMKTPLDEPVNNSLYCCELNKDKNSKTGKKPTSNVCEMHIDSEIDKDKEYVGKERREKCNNKPFPCGWSNTSLDSAIDSPNNPQQKELFSTSTSFAEQQTKH
eukprot:m.16786 g.16786  ORF g.16786 m.16786 type:complete len:513 (+) comp8046_c0_seq2:468-2006(+)